MGWIVFKAVNKVYMIPATQVSITAHISHDKTVEYLIHHSNVIAGLKDIPQNFSSYEDAVKQMQRLQEE